MMHSDFEHLPAEWNVPIECSACGSLGTLLGGSDDLSDLCSCDAPFRIYISDARQQAGALEGALDEILGPDDVPAEWAHTTRDDLGEE